VPDPASLRDEMPEALALAARESSSYVGSIGDQLVLDPGAEQLLAGFDGELPATGAGAVAALSELIEIGVPTATRSSGPRFFHFVQGGTTPAALGADWLTSALDQSAFAWTSSALGSRLEAVALAWLLDLFELPRQFGGVLVSGDTMANFTGLLAARDRCAELQGIDVDDAGAFGLEPPAVLSSGYVHPSAVQAIGMLGLGRSTVRRLARDEAGRLDLDSLEAALARAGENAIVIANAGEVNTGDFDPIDSVADLVGEHGGWLHVDAAFGLCARLTPESRGLAAGIERADSIAADAHKWLNVPYDCGFAFVREPGRLARGHGVDAAYLPAPDDPRPSFGLLSPENSRRARALAIWATLRAYGRDGHREMVERHLALARHLGAIVEAEPALELLAEVQLNIVLFRAHPPGIDERGLDRLNRALGEALLRDGRVFAGTTTYAGKVALRPAIVNWQTTEADVELLVEVVLELLDEEGAG
jgi:glutamate/tyrosine decarboxylase-like PLP-dependent enzyme